MLHVSRLSTLHCMLAADQSLRFEDVAGAGGAKKAQNLSPYVQAEAGT
jgi:hypothetical protein